MNETAEQRMRRILNHIGCYRLTGETAGDWDLKACGAGLDSLEQSMEGLLGDLFAFTASEKRLDVWEKTFRPQRSAGTLEERRSMLAQKLAINPRSFLPGDFSSMLQAAGVTGVVLEQEGGLRILLGDLTGLTEEETCRELEQILPAHLAWELDKSVTWTALDALGKTFQRWDAMRKSWSQLDALTREQLS